MPGSDHIEVLNEILALAQGMKGRIDLLERDMQHSDANLHRDITDLRTSLAELKGIVTGLVARHQEDAPVLDFARGLYKRALGAIAAAIIAGGVVQSVLPMLLERVLGGGTP